MRQHCLQLFWTKRTSPRCINHYFLFLISVTLNFELLVIIWFVHLSQSTDGGDLTVTYRAAAGKKMNQRKRARSERTNSSQHNMLKDCAIRWPGTFLSLWSHETSPAIVRPITIEWNCSYPCPFLPGRCGQIRGRCIPMHADACRCGN